jgi:hypothetical protein
MSELPWFVPGFVIALLVAIVVSDRLGRALGTHRIIAWAIVMGFGGALAATLSPGGANLAPGGVGFPSCDFARLGLASIDQFLTVKDIRLNLLLLMPLGIAIGLIPRSRAKAVLLAAAIALPFAVEGTQALLTLLGRACESGDVIDNLTGLIVGLGLGTIAGRIAVKSGYLSPR